MNKVKDKVTAEMIEDLYKILLKLETVEDCKNFFEDVCTFQEIEKMAQRTYAAKLLLEGKTYAQTIDETAISSATLSRVSRCIQHGKGYNKFLKD